jgi:hypothetical protein
MRPRPIAKLRGPFEQQLAAYAMAAGASCLGLLASSQPAAAKIVYTKVDQELPVDVPFPLDLNDDGIADFSLYFGAGNYGSFGISITPEQTNEVAGYCLRLSGTCWASALRPGVRVGANLRLGPYNDMVFGGCSFPARQSSSSCEGRGPWDNVQHRYLGFEFFVKGQGPLWLGPLGCYRQTYRYACPHRLRLRDSSEQTACRRQNEGARRHHARTRNSWPTGPWCFGSPRIKRSKLLRCSVSPLT